MRAPRRCCVSQKLEVKRLVDANPLADKFICTGIRFESAPKSENLIVRARAKAACDYAKSLNPALSTFFQNKPTKARSFAGKVLFTLKGPDVVSSNHFSYRYRNGVLERKGNLDSSWSASPNAPLLRESVRARAFENLKAAAFNGTPAKANWIIGKNVPKSMEMAYRVQVAEALAYFDFSGLKEPIDILVYTEKDRDVPRDYWSKMHSGQEAIERKTRALDDFVTGGEFRSVGGSAGPAHPLDGSYPRVAIDFTLYSGHTEEKSLLIEHVAHEIAHAWQYHALGMPEKLTSSQRFDFSASNLPCHLMEGGANNFGPLIPSQYSDWYAEAADVIIRRTARELKLTSMTNQKALELLGLSENSSSCGPGYSVGMLANEWLVAEYGAAAFMDLYREIGRGLSYEAALTKITGLTKAEYYQSVAPHITQSFRTALAKS